MDSNKTILLVEDEALIAMAQRHLLSRNGYTVVLAATGEKAVAIVDETPQIDLVLMDINLGRGIDGTEAARRILEHHDLPIVFLSSHTEPEVVEKTEKITSYGYIVKNSGETVLMTSIKMAFRLFESRQLAAATFDNSVNGLCVHRILRDQDGNPFDCLYLKANDAFGRQIGHDAGDLVERTLRDVFSQEEADSLLELFVDVLSHRRPPENRYESPSSGRRYDVSVFPVRGDEFTVVLQDVTERATVQDRIAAERERLAVTLRSVGDGVIATDAEGRITLINAVAERLTGYASRAAEGKLLREVFRIYDATTRAPHEDPVERVLREGKVIGLANHTVLVSASGEERQIADSAAPICDATGCIIGVVLVFRDVTEEYAVQRKLRESEGDMRRAQKLARLGSWRFNLSSGTVTPSPESREIYGIADTELTIPQVQAVPLPEYRATLDESLRNLVQKGTPYDVEFEIRRPIDGTSRFVHSVAEYNPEENVVVGTLQDITSRKRTERMLREERARFRQITELTPIGIVTFDADGAITYANSAAERTLGLHRSEITSRTYDAPEWRSTDSAGGPISAEKLPFAIVRRTRDSVYDLRHGISWPDGRRVELSVSGSPILDDDGAFQGMVATIAEVQGSPAGDAHR